MTIERRTRVRVIEKPVEKIVEKEKIVMREPNMAEIFSSLECCVCGGNNYLVKTHCHHFICMGCFTNLQKAECPMTRIKFENVPDKIKVICAAYHADSDDAETDYLLPDQGAPPPPLVSVIEVELGDESDEV